MSAGAKATLTVELTSGELDEAVKEYVSRRTPNAGEICNWRVDVSVDPDSDGSLFVAHVYGYFRIAEAVKR